MLYGVIIAGGSGKRLWPKSRRNYPKYLLKLNGKTLLLTEAVNRLKIVMPPENIFIFTNKEHTSIIRRQLREFPQKNILGEPVSRNTAPAVCFAASIVHKRDPDGIIFVLPADQIIEDKVALKKIFILASLIARMRDAIVTIGIRPDFAATGYGYIKRGRLYKSLISDKRYDVYKVDSFIEKPPLKMAKAFLKSDRYYWNSGIFIGKAGVFLNEFKKYQPRIYDVIRKIQKKGLMNRYYSNSPNISIDYAIMEKTKLAYVIGADIYWNDIGSWLALDKYYKKDIGGNIIKGKCLGIDVNNSIISVENDHLIAAIGLRNMVIIQTKDATLICPKERAEDVKGIVELAEKKALKRYL